MRRSNSTGAPATTHCFLPQPTIDYNDSAYAANQALNIRNIFKNNHRYFQAYCDIYLFRPTAKTTQLKIAYYYHSLQRAQRSSVYLRVRSISTALLFCSGIFMKEAASVTWRAVRQWRRGWGTFCDKGIAVKSERAEGVSVGDPQRSSSPVAPLPPLPSPRVAPWHTATTRISTASSKLWLQQTPPLSCELPDSHQWPAAVRSSHVGRQGSR